MLLKQNSKYCLLGILSHWAPPFSVSFLPATQQPLIACVSEECPLLLPATLSLLITKILVIPPSHLGSLHFLFLVISVPIHYLHHFSPCCSSFTSTGGILLLTTSGFSLSYESFSQIVFPADPAPFGL